MQHLPYYFVLDYGNYKIEKNNGQEGYIGRKKITAGRQDASLRTFSGRRRRNGAADEPTAGPLPIDCHGLM